MPRGVLVDVKTILLVDGKRIRTFRDCDESYLEDKDIAIGDAVSFQYVTGTKEAAEIEKVTPTAKERQLQQAATKKSAKASTVETALIAAKVIVGATAAELAEARQDLDVDADDAAFQLLANLPGNRIRGFATGDDQTDGYLLTELNTALRSKVTLEATKPTSNRGATVSFVANGEARGEHVYADRRALLAWLQAQLAKFDRRRLYFLACHEGWAALIITPAQAEQLREGNVGVETEISAR
jgi:hypothetical protein